MAKTLARIDHLRTTEQQTNFIKQFNFKKIDVDKLLKNPTLGESYLLSEEDKKDIKQKLTKHGRRAFKRKCKFSEDEMMKQEPSKRKKTEEVQKDLEDSFKNGTIGREKFAQLCWLNDKEKAGLDNNFKDFGKEAFTTKYRLSKKDIERLKKIIEKFEKNISSLGKTSCLIVVIMSHGRKGKIYGKCRM